jgi:hypothetical protein
LRIAALKAVLGKSLYRFLLKAFFGNFFALPEFAFTKKNSTSRLGWWSFCVIRLKQLWAIAISFSG